MKFSKYEIEKMDLKFSSTGNMINENIPYRTLLPETKSIQLNQKR